MEIPASLIDRIRKSAGNLGKAEAALAGVIIEDIDAATHMSTGELAGRANVSEPTVTRFSRRMGCSGFKDFKLQLARDLAVARMYLAADKVPPARSAREVSEQTHELVAQTLAMAFAQRDPVAIEAAVDAIEAARRLFCFGVGGSSANIAQEAENRFFRLDVPASASADPYRQRMTATISDSRDVFLMFSMTGKAASLIDSAQIARSAGARVISATHPGSPLAKRSDILLPLTMPEDSRFFYMPTRGRYGQLYILDCLASTLGARRSEQASAALWRIKRMLLTLHGDTPGQPIGD
jgi:RpiR family carbohydrate utilization transcriptional regulator